MFRSSHNSNRIYKLSRQTRGWTVFVGIWVFRYAGISSVYSGKSLGGSEFRTCVCLKFASLLVSQYRQADDELTMKAPDKGLKCDRLFCQIFVFLVSRNEQADDEFTLKGARRGVELSSPGNELAAAFPFTQPRLWFHLHNDLQCYNFQHFNNSKISVASIHFS